MLGQAEKKGRGGPEDVCPEGVSQIVLSMKRPRPEPSNPLQGSTFMTRNPRAGHTARLYMPSLEAPAKKGELKRVREAVANTAELRRHKVSRIACYSSLGTILGALFPDAQNAYLDYTHQDTLTAGFETAVLHRQLRVAAFLVKPISTGTVSGELNEGEGPGAYAYGWQAARMCPD